MKKVLFLVFILFGLSCVGQAKPEKNSEKKEAKKEQKLYKTVFKNFTKLESIKVEDNVSKEKNNNTLIKVYQDDKLIGFIREISTTTGCNSACLPVEYTTFFDAKGNFIKIKSRPGLTKINHEPLTADDQSRLELIIAMDSEKLNKVGHPEELTDALSGETLKIYQNEVVKGAAYSTLRIYLFHKETIRHIKNHIQKN